MVYAIPKGYKIERDAKDWDDFRMGAKFIGNYCRLCKKSSGCDLNHSLRSAMGMNMPGPWDESMLIMLRNKKELLDKKVHCYSFEKPTLDDFASD